MAFRSTIFVLNRRSEDLHRLYTEILDQNEIVAAPVDGSMKISMMGVIHISCICIFFSTD